LQTDFTDARNACAAFEAARDGIYDTVVLSGSTFRLPTGRHFEKCISPITALA
jgi:hypothetical protein